MRALAGDDELVEALDLSAGELHTPAQLAQRDAGGVVARRCCRAGDAARPARQPAAATACPVKRARRSSGPVRISALAWLIVWVRSPAALRLATMRARIASTAPSRPLDAPRARPDWAARAALTASPGRTGGLPRRSPLRTVRATHRGIRLKQAAGALQVRFAGSCLAGVPAAVARGVYEAGLLAVR